MAEETFKDKFYAAIDAAKATEEMAREFKEGDGRCNEDSPTGKPKIYINHNKF